MRRVFNARWFSALGYPREAIEYMRRNDEDTTQVIDDLDAHVAAADPHTQYLKEADAATTYAPIAKGVTNGDSHDHNGGDGAQISHANLSNILGGTYHVVAPQAAIPDAVGGDEAAKINAILAVMRTHGLINT